MTIDWITVSAQIINFLILVYLLKRFLYRPVLDAMAAREQKISQQLSDAQQQQLDAQAEHQHYDELIKHFEEARQKQLSEAAKDAESLSLKLLEEARQELVQTRKGWLEQLQQEKSTFIKEWQLESSKSVLKTTRHVLKELANTDVNTQLINTFIKQLKTNFLQEKSLTPDQQKQQNIEIFTSFELHSEQKTQLIEALKSQFGQHIKTIFKTNYEISLGIEVIAGEKRFAWSLDHYFNDLEQNLRQQFDQHLNSV